MKGKLTKKLIGILILGTILMYLFSCISFADTSQIDLNSFENMTYIPTTNSVNNTQANNTVVNNTLTNNTTNNTQTNKVIPQTGSNNEFIYMAGLTILIGTTVYIYRQTKIK